MLDKDKKNQPIALLTLLGWVLMGGIELKTTQIKNFRDNVTHVRDNIASDLVMLDQKFENFEGFFIELELSRKNKSLLSYSYNPHKGNTKEHLSNISKGLDELNSKYDNILIIGNLNSEMSKPSLDEFCQTYNLETIVNKPTCFKNPKKNGAGAD